MDKIDREIMRYLVEIGYKASNSGFLYTAEAIKIIVKNNLKTKPVMTNIYKPVAKKFETTTSKVERAIRHEREHCKSKIKNLDNAEFMTQIAIELFVQIRV